MELMDSQDKVVEEEGLAFFVQEEQGMGVVGEGEGDTVIVVEVAAVVVVLLEGKSDPEVLGVWREEVELPLVFVAAAVAAAVVAVVVVVVVAAYPPSWAAAAPFASPSSAAPSLPSALLQPSPSSASWLSCSLLEPLCMLDALPSRTVCLFLQPVNKGVWRNKSLAHFSKKKGRGGATIIQIAGEKLR